MQIQCDRYTVSFYREDGGALRQLPLDVDWEPAREQLIWDALRADASAGLPVRQGGLLVEPIWDEQLGEPVIGGFRLRAGQNGQVLQREFPAAYFKRQVRQISAQLVETGELNDGEIFRYQVRAYRQASIPKLAPHSAGGLRVEEVSRPPAIDLLAMDPFIAASCLHGLLGQDDFPAFIPQLVLDEITARTERAGPVEGGGFFIGHLHRDRDRPDVVFVEVTAEVPAVHARGEAMKLTFTSESWAAVDAAIRLRGRGELMIGWDHWHPQKFWCRDCPPERRAVCPLQQGAFFSTSDCAVHRTVFPQAYSLALLANHTEHGVEFALFGWRQGVIVNRGFYVLGATRPAAAAPARMEDEPYATTCTH